MSILHIEMDLRNQTTSEFSTVLDSPLGVPNSQVPLYVETGQALLEPVLAVNGVNGHYRIRAVPFQCSAPTLFPPY